jgi:hypothetical protein
MESLFSRLFKYRERENRSPEEDYMTELIAYIFQNHRSVLLSFLKECNINLEDIEIEGITVSTQYVLGNLESRPDIAIKLIKRNGKQSIIFLENKINAAEGLNQLYRYFTYLSEKNQRNVQSCHLIYITKYYDSKENLNFLTENKSKVSFTQLRWWQVFRILKQFDDIEIISEALKFMKERGLNMSRNFNFFDINTLMNMNRVKEMVQESLSEKAEEMFYEISGTKYSMTSAESQLRTTGRYIYMGNQDDWFWIGIGYWFEGKVIDAEYPDIGVVVGVKPYHDKRDSIINAISEFTVNNTAWKDFGLTNEDEWAGMWRKVSLKEMLSNDDHISSIQEWYIDALSDIAAFKEKYTRLPWKVK